MTESINPNNTSELITESENQNGSTDRLVNESKKSNVVNDVSVEDKTNLLDLSESRDETSQNKK